MSLIQFPANDANVSRLATKLDEFEESKSNVDGQFEENENDVFWNLSRQLQSNDSDNEDEFFDALSELTPLEQR